MKRYDPVSGKLIEVQDQIYGDNFARPVRPLTGVPIETYPDVVDSSAMQRDTSDPNKPYASAVPLSGRAVGTGTAALTPPGQGSTPMIGLSGPAVPTAGEAMIAALPQMGAGSGPMNSELEAPSPEAIAPAAPAPPPITIGPVTETTSTRLGAGVKAAQADQVVAAGEAAKIAGRAGDVGIANARESAGVVASEEATKDAARAADAQSRLELAAKRDAIYGERDRILDDAEKTSLKGYWTDKSAGAHVLANFASALGTYVAIRSGSGRNYAQETLDRDMARDDAAKQMRLKQSIYRAGLKGADADRAFEYGTQELSLRKADMLGKLADHRASVLAQHGVAAAEIARDTAVNDAQTKKAALIEQFGHYADVKVHSSNELAQRYKLAQAEAQGATGKGPDRMERVTAEAAADSANSMERAAQLIKANPKAWKEYQTALKEQAQIDALGETKVGKELYASAQYLGAANVALEQRLKSPMAKAIHSALVPVITAKARELDPVGVLNIQSVAQGRDALGLLTRAPDAVVGEIQNFRDRKIGESRAAAGNTGYIPPAASRAPVGGPSSVDTARMIARAEEYLRSNPGDKAVRAKLDAMVAARGR